MRWGDLCGGSVVGVLRANQPAEDYDTQPRALDMGRCMRRDW